MRVMRRSGGDMGRGSDQRSVFSIQWSAEYTRSVIERGVTGAWQREDGEVTARSRHSLVGLIVEDIKCSFSTTNTSSYPEVVSGQRSVRSWGGEVEGFVGAVAEDGVVPVFDFGADEVGVHAPEDGDDGHVGEEEGFGFLHGGDAAGGVGLAGGGEHEFVVARAGPAGVVVAVAGAEDAEEGEGVCVVADPAGAGEVVVEGLLGVDVDLPFLLEDADFDAEVFFPTFLEELGDGAGGGAGVGEDFHFAEAFAAGESGFGEEGAGGGGIEAEDVEGFVVGMGAGRGEAGGGQVTGADDLIDEGDAVDGEGEGLADFGVVEGRAGGVEAIEFAGEFGALVEEGWFGFAVAGDFGEGDGVGDVELAVEEDAFFGFGVVDGEEVDGVEFGGGGVPVAGIFFDGDEVVDAPVFEGEGAAGDDVAGSGPGGVAGGHGAEAFDDVAGDGEPSVVFEHAREVGGGAFEGEDEAMGAGGSDADGGEVFGFAAVELGGAFEEVEHFGVGGAEFGREDALEGVEVVG